MENVQEIPSVISAACVLHNFCLIADEASIEEFLDLDNDGDDDENFRPEDIWPLSHSIVKVKLSKGRNCEVDRSANT